MTNTKATARETLQALVQGVDPATRNELSHDSVLQRADVIRAMLAGVEALKDAEERKERREKMPTNMGRAWSEAENDRLLEQFHHGVDVEAIAAAHQRTVRAIEARLVKIGLMNPEQRKTRDRF